MSNDVDLFTSFRGLAEELQAVNQRAVREYGPIVEHLVRTGSRDSQEIEHTLDGLLGFCGDASALALYKTLCRHYWSIDPAATAFYVHAYREMWESEDKPEDAGEPDAQQGGDA